MLSKQNLVVGAFVPSVSNQLGMTLREHYAVSVDETFANLIAALTYAEMRDEDDAAS